VPSAVRTGELPVGNPKELIWLEGVKERSCERISARGPIGLHQFGIRA
jgi:hypothetical protein